MPLFADCANESLGSKLTIPQRTKISDLVRTQKYSIWISNRIDLRVLPLFEPRSDQLTSNAKGEEWGMHAGKKRRYVCATSTSR